MSFFLQSGLDVGDQLVTQLGVATQDDSNVGDDVLDDGDLVVVSQRFAQFGQLAGMNVEAFHEAKVAVFNLLRQTSRAGRIIVSKDFFGRWYHVMCAMMWRVLGVVN